MTSSAREGARLADVRIRGTIFDTPRIRDVQQGVGNGGATRVWARARMSPPRRPCLLRAARRYRSALSRSPIRGRLPVAGTGLADPSCAGDVGPREPVADEHLPARLGDGPAGVDATVRRRAWQTGGKGHPIGHPPLSHAHADAATKARYTSNSNYGRACSSVVEHPTFKPKSIDALCCSLLFSSANRTRSSRTVPHCGAVFTPSWQSVANGFRRRPALRSTEFDAIDRTGLPFQYHAGASWLASETRTSGA